MYDMIGTDDILMGRYRLEMKIGMGAFGAVYSAIDQQTGERVAIKSLPPQRKDMSPTTLARFQREMKVISALVHRNIIGLYDFGQTPHGAFFMVLEYAGGQSLEATIQRGALAPRQVLSVCEQMASALLLAHHLGVIHRDLKPANIMLIEQDEEYLVKVLDFGTAKLLQRIDDDPVDQLTREGIAVGTPRYIAPEQARGQQVGPWTDLYALGLLMYEMLTGARAVKADDIEGAVMAHISPHPLELAEIDRVPRAFRPILARLIDKNPVRRYQSAETLLVDLEQVRYEMFDAGAGRQRLDPVRARLIPGPGSPPASHAPMTSQPPLTAEAGSPVAGRHEAAAGHATALQQLPDEVARADAPLELDWGDHPRANPPQGAPSPDARRLHAPRDPPAGLLRMPDRPAEWVEAALSPLVALFAFLLLGAQLNGMEYAMRLGIVLSPGIIAIFWAIFSGRKDWRYSFFRLWNLFSLAAALIAHAMGPRELITELMRGSTWFLNPLLDMPGMEMLADLLSWTMRRYAVVLSTTIEWAGISMGA